MKQPFGAGLLAATLLALSSSAAFADYQLNILHFNDFHSRVESINKFDSTCSAAGSQGDGRRTGQVREVFLGKSRHEIGRASCRERV